MLSFENWTAQIYFNILGFRNRNLYGINIHRTVLNCIFRMSKTATKQTKARHQYAKRKIGSLIIMPMLRNIIEEFVFSRCLFVNTGFYLSWTFFFSFFFIWICKHPPNSLGCLSRHITLKFFQQTLLAALEQQMPDLAECWWLLMHWNMTAF